MKLAPVVPKQFHGLLDRMRFGMCFVEPSIGLQDEQYLNHYRRESERGKYIIMDNGMAEAGYDESKVSFRDVLEIADSLRADEVIMPDKAKDSGWTIRASRQNAKYVPEKNRALVIHGEDWEDWVQSLYIMVEIGGRTLCIPKMYEAFPGGRAYALDLIKNAGYRDMFDIHLLGLYGERGAASEIAALNKRQYGVRSLDTGAAIACAQHDIGIGDHRANFSMDWGGTATDSLVSNNLSSLRSMCYAYHNN